MSLVSLFSIIPLGPPDKLLKRAGALARATGGKETGDCSATTTACARQHPPETRVAPSSLRGVCEEGGGGPRWRRDLPARERGCWGQAGAPPRHPRHPRRCCGSVRGSDTATVFFFFLHPLPCCGAPSPSLPLVFLSLPSAISCLTRPLAPSLSGCDLFARRVAAPRPFPPLWPPLRVALPLRRPR